MVEGFRFRVPGLRLLGFRVTLPYFGILALLVLLGLSVPTGSFQHAAEKCTFKPQQELAMEEAGKDPHLPVSFFAWL